MKKRVLSILLAATMVGTMIAGCGNSGGNSEGGSSDSGMEKEAVLPFSLKADLRRKHWQMKQQLILRQKQDAR